MAYNSLVQRLSKPYEYWCHISKMATKKPSVETEVEVRVTGLKPNTTSLWLHASCEEVWCGARRFSCLLHQAVLHEHYGAIKVWRVPCARTPALIS